MQSRIFYAVNVGIGDLLIAKSEISHQRAPNAEVYICPNYELVDKYRNGRAEYFLFLDEFLSFLFPSSEKYHVLRRDEIVSCKMAVLTPKGFRDKLFQIISTEEFVIIPTKVREFNRQNYEKSKDVIFKALNPHKIVIVGEKTIDENLENTILTEKFVFSIYDDLKTYFPNAQDMASNTCSTSPNLTNLTKDMKLYSSAKFVFTFGIGGPFCIAAFCSKKMISYIEPQNLKYPWVSKAFGSNRAGEDAIVTPSLSKILQELSKYV